MVDRTVSALLGSLSRKVLALEKRQTFRLPQRLSTTGRLATDLNQTIDAGDYRGVSPANAPIATTVAAWRVTRGGGAGDQVRQEFHRVSTGGAYDTRVWVRHSSDAGATWSAWQVIAGTNTPDPVDLSSYVLISGGSLYGLRDGNTIELFGGGFAIPSSASAVNAWSALPAEWRPRVRDRIGTGYAGAYIFNVVIRPNGTGAFGNRTSGSALSSGQFSLTYVP